MGNIGSAAIASWIAHITFVVLIIRVWLELRPRTAIVFAILWLAGYFGFPWILYGEGFFMPYVAVLDVTMLMMLNHHDSPISLR
jgi:hypothetical protein